MIIRFAQLVLLVVLTTASLQAQPSADSLRAWLATHPKADTNRVNNMTALSDALRSDDYIQAMQLAHDAQLIAQKLHYPLGEANALFALGVAYGGRTDYATAEQYLRQARQKFEQLGNRLGVARVMGQLGWIDTNRGNYVAALSTGLQCLKLARQLNDPLLLRQTTGRLAMLYNLLGDYEQALRYYTAALDLHQQTGQESSISRLLNGIGELYRNQGDLKKATRYYNKAIRLAQRLGNEGLQAEAESNLAAVEVQQGHTEQALQLGRQALRVMLARGGYEVVSWTYTVLGRAHLQLSEADSAIYYGRRSWNLSRHIGYKEVTRDASDVLAKAYALKNNYREAYRFRELNAAYNDTLSGRQTQQQLALLQQNTLTAERQAQAALQAEADRRQRQWLVSALIGLALVGIVAIVLWRSYRRQQQANEQLRQQQAELQAAQNQLVQSEKMASLGELTAGIAHEIQNPLNFVNNFAEVSVELVDELMEEQQKPERDTELETELLTDLAQNLQKIGHHGQRASGIVRSMLQHSRTSTGQREPTDLNALADEYLRLAYHGLRAKDKTVNAELITDFDPAVGKINVVSQDIGRVLLNLFNNAFYAVQQRQKNGQQDQSYRPTVAVRTKRTGSTVAIHITDTGTGMPDLVKQKIFQPFFTTKPTGEGTGLGLSLAYDIVTKGHTGSMTVESRDGEGTSFVITLPV
ncbi:tetratricopeptide repeat protein [Spirosoma utsteinense]|uniref:histidine kinase n=1 Tax=Spirosoma utsteinense TaxID=2585773 RepID=A0ABR6W2J8_9BACT|nr:tetratricopeptide repeat protein [Spirosoma utsteinense]MBC3785013.1 signal transduction histidine kinase [Spirosoma utsteinense]MBC3790378.1 signal transduction histidine kinase [Spirosoma utsteinense]